MTCAIFNEAFFDVFIGFNNPTDTEINATKNGDMKLFLFEKSNVPFIILDYIGTFNLDINLDITKLNDTDREKWLSSKSNVINIFLVDSATGILKSIRMLSIKFADEIRDILRSQLTNYNVGNDITQVLNQYSTRDMIKGASKYQKFTRS